jgi:hypothetical protein
MPRSRALDLLEGDVWFRLKLNRVGDASLLPPFAVVDPRLRQVQAVRHRHARLFRDYRKADRYPAVILLANLATILSGHSYGLTPLLGKSGVIDHPCHHRVTAQNRRDHKIQTPIQYRFVAPRRVGNHMMQRLMHAPHLVGSESGGHGFDALTLAE